MASCSATTPDEPDGLPPREGAFLACSFWLADAYVLLGRIGDAERLFERLLALRNDVGLLAEEYDTDARRLVGNFPQAFSHVALVNTAHNLARCRQAGGTALHLRLLGRSTQRSGGLESRMTIAGTVCAASRSRAAANDDISIRSDSMAQRDILVVDVGGNHIKMLATGHRQRSRSTRARR